MTLDEAIKWLELGVDAAEAIGAKKQVAAYRLGIEALKREKSYREYEFKDKWFPLPGETKD